MTEEHNGKKSAKVSSLEAMAGGSPEHVTDIDAALNQARAAQEQEQLHEQVRMERLHVSAMCLQGILASGDTAGPKYSASMAVKYADSLLKAVMK